ncbi:winged helix-turn-helix domain-containing protein [Dactylosporangium sp. NPDC051541]|uniref:winged helix-turn-helix domain-containing protein n=1 Tax=Dactylosporangium sp. NPDC051541 TaxID=3363977 RepID=UPI0037B7A269
MRSRAPDLLPLFRSRHQADLLAWLYLHPEQEYTATELATRFGLALTTVLREANRLVEAGLLRARTVGRARLLKAALDHRVAAPLTQLLAYTFGPQTVLEEVLLGIEGVRGVYIYGSWAARYAGRPGPPPGDVDVLILGAPARADVYAASDIAQERLGLPVNPTIRTVEQWLHPIDGLVKEIQASPLVTVFDLDADRERDSS